MIKRPDTNAQRIKRHKRVRAKISGTPERPRLNVFRSEKNIYAQIIDDVNGKTLVSASSLEKDFSCEGTKTDAAKQVVTLMAIDKKKLKLKEAGLPAIVYEQTPWYARRAKIPVVKAKIGPRIMTMIADEKVFLQLPLKTEAKVVISGMYITEIKSVRGGIPPLPEKKKFLDRFRKKKDDQKKNA